LVNGSSTPLSPGWCSWAAPGSGIPRRYERALASEGWHDAQHTCFLATALIFWWPVVQPWPSRPVVPLWGIVLYLILADLQNTVLSAWLVFAERVI
jgi:putative membrane protein